MGGLKRKIPTDKIIEKKESKSVAFSKRRKGLYSKTAQLCLLSRAQAAILITPASSKSNVSFYSFGHSSVDSVVSAFLANNRPREDLGSEFWWEDEGLAESKDMNELSEALDSISRTLQNLKGLRSAAMANREDMKKKKKKEVVLDRNQTLNLPSTSASICIHEDPLPPENYHGLAKNIKEEDQIVAMSDNKNKKKDLVIHGTHQELGRNQTLDFQSSSASLCIQDVTPENLESFVNNSEHKDQIVASSDSSNNTYGLPGNLDEFSQEVDLSQFIDMETNSEYFIMTNLKLDDVSTNRYSCSDSEGAEDGAMVIHSNSHEDNLHFSELNDDQIVAISDNNNSNNALPGHLYGCNQEVTPDQIFEMVTDYEGLSVNSEMDDVSMINTSQDQNWCSNYKAVEDGSVVFFRDLDQDNLQFSEFFNS